MHIGARVAIGVGSVGGVIGGGYGLNKLLSNETIKSKLEANKYVLLTDKEDDNKHWETILASYKTIIETDSNSKFKFDDFLPKGRQPNQEDKIKIKKFCKNTLEKRTFDDTKEEENYKKAIKWCTLPQKASQRLDTIGFKALDTTKENSKTNTDDNEWEKKIKAYVDEKNKNQISNWEEGKSIKADKDGKEKLMAKCKTMQDTETHQKDYETIFEEAKQWCAIPKTK